jgi:hypothetical protein
MFTERDAIEFEMNELKEQARRDYEIYLTSRNMRNERYSQLMDRLREIDERPHRKEVVLKNKEVTKEMWESVKNTPPTILPQPKFQGDVQELRVDYIDKPRKYVKLEEIDPVVQEFLKEQGYSVQAKDIQKHVESKLGAKWENFSGIMYRLIELNPRIKKASKRGMYYYD